jgi:hypothetical protein
MALDLPDKRASSDQPIAGGKPTSHLLIRGSGLDYFRVANYPINTLCLDDEFVVLSYLGTMIRSMARQEGTDYIAIYETIIAEIMKSPQRRAFTGFSFLPFYRDAVRTLVLRKSPDEVARINGWRFHTDGVHLNSRSGLIVADLVQKFIEK